MDQNLRGALVSAIDVAIMASNMLNPNASMLDRQYDLLESAQNIKHEQIVRSADGLGDALQTDRGRPAEIRPK